MSDLILKVKTKKTFEFTPNQLVIRPIATDVINGQSTVYFSLKDINLDNSRYITREWKDEGNVIVPLQLLASCVNADGTLNADVVNQFLSVFNLELDTE